jgi:hypothetical protein
MVRSPAPKPCISRCSVSRSVSTAAESSPHTRRHLFAGENGRADLQARRTGRGGGDVFRSRVVVRERRCAHPHQSERV